KVKTLGEEEPWLDDAAAWIERSRALQREKELAEKRAKLLEEMDQEFGVSPLVEEEFQRRRRERYSARDLQGLTVEHDPASIPEGQTLVLTLKDRGQWGHGDVGDTGVAQGSEEQELRRRRPNYDPYGEQEPAPGPQVPCCDISRYIGAYSDVPWCTTPYREIAQLSMRASRYVAIHQSMLRCTSWRRETRLDVAMYQSLSRYISQYHSTLAVTFRKTRRRVRKLRKKEKPLRADDLLATAPGDTQGDFGSRWGKFEGSRGNPPRSLPKSSQKIPRSPLKPHQKTPKTSLKTPPKTLSPQHLKKLPLSTPKSACGDPKISLRIPKLALSSNPKIPPQTPKSSLKCPKTLPNCLKSPRTPPKIQTSRGTPKTSLWDSQSQNLSQRQPPDSEGEENVGWSSVNLAEERQHQDFSASSTTILDEEPIVNRGLAAALLLCQNKGLLETTVQKVARVKAPNKSLPSAVYCIEDKMAIDDKYSRREEFRGFTQDFKEKDGYRPDVKIEYVDETGRKLTPKEAFRQLSHRFHGKGSGKMKTERRMKKLDEEALLKKMSSSDTPLGTVALLQEKQRAQKTPYIVLSGSGKSMNA
ncbi:SNUT1 protein, partial [Vidua macroura]|nr:SNUT1 protein [Vidua macroura]